MPFDKPDFGEEELDDFSRFEDEEELGAAREETIEEEEEPVEDELSELPPARRVPSPRDSSRTFVTPPARPPRPPRRTHTKRRARASRGRAGKTKNPRSRR